MPSLARHNPLGDFAEGAMRLPQWALTAGQRFRASVLWLEDWSLVRFLAVCATLSLGVAAVQFISSREESQAAERKAAHYEAWRVITAAQGKGGSGGRIDALQDLARDSVSLSGVNLEGAWLQGLDVRRSDLTGANMTRADLRFARLDSSGLSNAVLVGANLTDASLKDATLIDAGLDSAVLNGTLLQSSNLENARLNGDSMSGADFTRAHVRSASFKGAWIELGQFN